MWNIYIMKILSICIGAFSAVIGWAQSLPPTNIFTQTGGPLPPPAIPPLTQVHVPQFNGDHSTDPDMARRQVQSITQNGRANGMSVTQFEAQMARLWGSSSIKPPPGSPGALHYAFAFQIVPPVTGTLSNGRNVTWNWIRFSHPDPTNANPRGVMGGFFVMRGDGTSNPPANLFTPPANAALPPVIQPTPAPLPAPLPVRPVAPAPPIKVSIHTWTQISTGGSSRTIVMRMVGNFRGITSPTPVRKPSRVVNAATSFQGQPRSRSAASSEFIFRGHGAFSMHIRSLPSKSFQRMSLRVGR